MTIRAQTETLGVIRMTMIVRRELPEWLTVTARENVFLRRVVVTVYASRWRKLRLGRSGRAVLLNQARRAAAGELPAGVGVEVVWR